MRGLIIFALNYIVIHRVTFRLVNGFLALILHSFNFFENFPIFDAIFCCRVQLSHYRQTKDN